LAIALTYGLQVWPQAFRAATIVQDDARQHLVWMSRFADANALPQDLIADYFQSVAPWGFVGLYQAMATIGIQPLLLSKLLPPVLALLTTGMAYLLWLEFLPLPVTAFVATALFNQNFWMRDDLASASPRAFLNLIFLAFLYWLVRGAWWPCLGAIVLLGGFYPQYVFVAAGILLLRLLQKPQQSKFLIAGLGVAGLILLLYALRASTFGPTISATEAKTLLEFAPAGRARFFFDDFGRYWLTGGRSGLQIPLDPPLLGLGLLLPVLLRFPARWPLLRQSQNLDLLGQLTTVALAMFLIAHALLFKLHLPSRYTQHSLRIVLAMAAAIVLTVLLDAAWRSLVVPRWTAIGLTVLTGCVLIAYPLTLGNFPKTTFVQGSATPIYEFLARQPPDTLTASLSEEANFLPIFAQRSTLVGSEYAIPYHVGYYRQFRQRVLDLLQAQYSSDPATVQRVLQTYGIDFWLVDRAAFQPAYLRQNGWLRQYQPAQTEALKHLEADRPPLIAQSLSRCTVAETEAIVLLNATCLGSPGATAP
jgi:hypothetical protein